MSVITSISSKDMNHKVLLSCLHMEATFNMSKLVFKGEMLSLWDKESVLYSIYKVKYTVFMCFWGFLWVFLGAEALL